MTVALKGDSSYCRRRLSAGSSEPEGTVQGVGSKEKLSGGESEGGYNPKRWSAFTRNGFAVVAETEPKPGLPMNCFFSWETNQAIQDRKENVMVRLPVPQRQLAMMTELNGYIANNCDLKSAPLRTHCCSQCVDAATPKSRRDLRPPYLSNCFPLPPSQSMFHHTPHRLMFNAFLLSFLTKLIPTHEAHLRVRKKDPAF